MTKERNELSGLRPTWGPTCLACSLAAGSAWAGETNSPPGTNPYVDVTDSSSVAYNGDNRDSQPNDVTTYVNDGWGAWYNHFNGQASHAHMKLGLRVDSAWFYSSPSAAGIALDMLEDRSASDSSLSDAEYFLQRFDEAGRDLSNRYINWTYPAKYNIGYGRREFELELGDVYAQFGRGLVLSLRKRDELASDTTLRGGRAMFRQRAGDLRLKLTAVAGSANPLRIDEASGRYLGTHTERSPVARRLLDTGMPRAIATDFVPEANECSAFGTCSFEPDDIFAGQFELSIHGATLASQASLVRRGEPLAADAAREARSITTMSQALDVPTLSDAAALYVEAAWQVRSDRSYESRVDDGYGLYASLDAHRSPLGVLFEGKHYRRFFPLAANVSVDRAPEFASIAYSAPPTTEAVYNDTEFEGFNTCVTGGRLKTDVVLAPGISVFAWVGHYVSHDESGANQACRITPEEQNLVWDVASGAELRGNQRHSSANFSFGARDDRSSTAMNTPFGETYVYYREVYHRSDIVQSISGPWSLQLTGWHRYRHQVVGAALEPWFEGQELLALEWAPKLNVAFGFEYDTDPRTPLTYLNGQVAYRFTTDSNVSLFVGQRRGALRCVAGVCRRFPAFEGARLDLTLRL